jgi:hypothetical protein
MICKSLSGLPFLLLLCSSQAFGAAFHWKFGIDLKEESVGDKETTFAVGDWNCKVGEPTKDGHGNEMRRLGCWVGEDGLHVYLLPVCYKGKDGKVRLDGGFLNLQQKKTGSVMASLSCS